MRHKLQAFRNLSRSTDSYTNSEEARPLYDAMNDSNEKTQEKALSIQLDNCNSRGGKVISKGETEFK